MPSASDLSLDVVVFFGATIFCILSGYLLDDFSDQLQWTLRRSYWMIRRKTGLLVRFCVHPICKSAFAGRVIARRRQRALLHPRFVRYGPSARTVAGRVVVPQRVTSSTLQLKPTQRRALQALESDPGASLTRSEYERLTGAGRSQAAYDLADLVSAGLIVRIGGGRSTRYALAHEPASQRRWTPDRIRHELDLFCANRSVWPTAGEFKTGGRGDLYVAASRYGGVAHWANELGLERIDRSRTATEAARVPLRSRLAWGFAGAVASGAIAAAAVTAIVATHQFRSGDTPGARASAGTQPSRRLVHDLLQPPFTASKPAGTRHASRIGRHVTRPTTKSTSRRSTPEQKTSFVSEPLQTASDETASDHTTPTTTETMTAVAAQSGGAAPLPAPTGASAPSPLKAP